MDQRCGEPYCVEHGSAADGEHVALSVQVNVAGGPEYVADRFPTVLGALAAGQDCRPRGQFERLAASVEVFLDLVYDFRPGVGYS